MSLFLKTPLPFLPSGYTVNAGSTQRLLTVSTASYSGQRALQTYLPAVNVLVVGDVWLHDAADTNPKGDLGKAIPYQLYHVYTTTLSSPDGDLPFKHGDQFLPNGALVGLVANTAHPIRGVQAYPGYVELIVERKL